MSGGASLLGPQKDRVKTDLRLPPEIMKQVEVVSAKMGVPKNAFFAIAASKFLIEISAIQTPVRKRTLEREIEKILQKILENRRNSS